MKQRRFVLPAVLITIFMLLFCANAFAEETEPQAYIKCDKYSVTVKNGEEATINIQSSTEISIATEDTLLCSSFIWNTAIENGSISTNQYAYRLSITGKGVGKTTVKIYHKDNPDIFTEITVKVTMTDEEKKNANAVRWISDREFFFYENGDAYVLLFALKDESEKRIAAPATVKIRIVNDAGETVYNKTRYVPSSAFGTWSSSNGTERYLGSVYIKPEDILPGESEKGTVYFEVRQSGYFSFSESKVSASKLPKIDLVKMSSLNAPEMPMTLSYSNSSGKIFTTVELTKLTYEFTEYSLEKKEVKLSISYTGQKTYDNVSDTRNAACRFYWKLYDAEGYIVATGTSNTSAIATGEKFKNGEISVYSLPAGEYTIKFFDSVS